MDPVLSLSLIVRGWAYTIQRIVPLGGGVCMIQFSLVGLTIHNAEGTLSISVNKNCPSVNTFSILNYISRGCLIGFRLFSGFNIRCL